MNAEIVRELLRISHIVIPHFIRLYRFMGLWLYIPRGVFNPIYTFSSSLIIKHVKPYGRLLDIGCGSGVLAIYFAKYSRVDEVYAYDTCPLSLATTTVNARLNGVEDKVRIIRSKEVLKEEGFFDYIASNPPYLPLDPRDKLDVLWCGGRNLEVLREIVGLSSKVLKNNGVLAITISSLTNPRKALHILASQGFKASIKALKKTPLDTIFLIEAKRISNAMAKITSIHKE